LRACHLAFYLRRARTIADAWCGPGQESGLALLRADHADLRAALESAFDAGQGTSAALELTGALRHHWYADGFLAEGRRWLDRALELSAPGGNEARADALWVVAWVALVQGDREAARARLDECERLAAPAAGARVFARALRGTAALFEGDLPAAVERFREAIDAGRELGEPSAMLAAYFQLGHSLAPTSRAHGQLAFSYGRHACAGQGLAKLETTAVFTAMARQVQRIELVGEPVLALNNTTRGFAKRADPPVLASEVHWAWGSPAFRSSAARRRRACGTAHRARTGVVDVRGVVGSAGAPLDGDVIGLEGEQLEVRRVDQAHSAPTSTGSRMTPSRSSRGPRVTS
jgi:hypothetical protein